jgi:oligosaccharide repeat unit polymerase
MPVIQYVQNRFPLWLTADYEKWILITNLFIITWIVFYVLGYYIRKIRDLKTLIPLEKLKINKRGVFVSISLSIMILIVFLSIFGFKNLLIRGEYREIIDSIQPHSIMVILEKFFKVIPLLSLMGVILIKDKWSSKRIWWVLIGLLIFINLLVNNPFASPRYWAGIVVLGFIIYIFFREKKRRGWVFLILLIGILILFPLSGELRDKTYENIRRLKISDLGDYYSSSSFDAYEMSVHTVQYVSLEGLTYGNQLLGPVLFWIPRSLWGGKPVGSGRIIARAFSYPEENLSCPLPFEGYINFGVAGLIIFAFGFGWVLSSLDEYYWNKEKKNFTGILSVYYPFLLGFTFYIMRGDLMSGFSYTVMFILAGLVLLVK